MSGGYWLDLLLVALLLMVAVVIYRLRPAHPAPLPPAADGERGPGAGWGRRLRLFQTTVIRQAGLEPTFWQAPIWMARLVLLALLPLLALEFWPVWWNGRRWPWLLLAALVGFILPDLLLLASRNARRRRISVALTYFLDLLVSLLRSGLGLEEAFRRAGRGGFAASHPLAREVALVSAELEAGRDQAAAFQALADRTGVRELRGIAASLALTQRLGASVRTTLETQAEMLWTRRRETALRRINAALVKAVFPVFLCGLPIFFVLVFFPVALELADLLGGLLEFWG